MKKVINKLYYIKKKLYIYLNKRSFFYIYNILFKNLKLIIMGTILIIWAVTLIVFLMFNALLGRSNKIMKKNFNKGIEKDYAKHQRITQLHLN